MQPPFLKGNFSLQNWRIYGCAPWWIFYEKRTTNSVYKKEVNNDIKCYYQRIKNSNHSAIINCNH